MVLTRYQAALAQFLAQGDGTASEDEEVEVHLPQHLHSAPCSDVDSVTSDISQGIDMAGQGERLGAVEDAVKEMNSKFDSLLAVMSGSTGKARPNVPAPGLDLPTAQSASGTCTPARTARGYNLHTPAGVPPPPPGFPLPTGLQGPGYDDYVLAQLRREDFQAQRVDDGKGFVNDIYNKVLAPKPYMYMDRPGVNTG